MVDHTFIFTGAVKKIKEIIDDKTLGKIYYYDSTRVNLGMFQHDVNVLWDLAAHDISIMDYDKLEKAIEVEIEVFLDGGATRSKETNFLRKEGDNWVLFEEERK